MTSMNLTRTPRDIDQILIENREAFNRPDAPVTEDEAALFDSVSQLPVALVERLPAPQALSMGALPLHCHSNCFSFVEDNPQTGARQIIGWLRISPDLYNLHSVLMIDERLVCVTPDTSKALRCEFTPDDRLSIELGRDGELYIVRLNHDRTPYFLRREREALLT